MCVNFRVRETSNPDAKQVVIEEAWTKTGTFNCPPLKFSDVTHLHHMKGLHLSDIKPSDVKLLIGANVPKAHLQVDVREGDPHQPVAIQTPLGWCIMGTSSPSSDSDRSVHVNFLSATDDSLHHQVERFWQTEAFGVAYNFKDSRSVEDQRSIKKLDEGTCFVQGHYEVPMLWRDEAKQMPNNRLLAERRFYSLNKRFVADLEFKAKYAKAMNDYIDKGYARKMDAEEIFTTSRKTWYLPHHSVTNPKKPEKVRIVFDAAAAYQNVSLNSCLMTGPDLLNSLFGVIQRFRTKPVAIVADIADMFYQVHVPEQDSDALRFFWKYDLDAAGPPDVYKMVVHTFGATDSPCCTNYALRRVADDDGYANDFVKDTIKNDFYVDDMLKSVDNDEIAVSLALDLTDRLASKGFRLTKWMSSSREVLSQIPQTTRARPDLDLDLGELPVERALGIGWDVESDSFVFNTSIRTGPVTKRQIVSVVGSIFDPIGFLTPFTLRAKCIIQELWRRQLGWDEEIGSVCLKK
jgi:hypothetical protein